MGLNINNISSENFGELVPSDCFQGGVDDLWFFFYTAEIVNFRSREAFFSSLILSRMQNEMGITDFEKESFDDFVSDIETLKDIEFPELKKRIDQWISFTQVNLAPQVHENLAAPDIDCSYASDIEDSGFECFFQSKSRYCYLVLVT